MLKISLFIICEAPWKISTIFQPFLAIFTLFHLKNWPYLQKPELCNLPVTRFWLPLVNKSICTIPLSWATPDINIMAGESCVTGSMLDLSVRQWVEHLLLSQIPTTNTSPLGPGPGLQLQRLQKRGCCVIVSSSQLNGIIQFNINIEHCLCSRLRTAILCHYAVNLALYLTTTYNSAINMRTLIWTCLNTATLASQGTYHHCNCI